MIENSILLYKKEISVKFKKSKIVKISDGLPLKVKFCKSQTKYNWKFSAECKLKDYNQIGYNSHIQDRRTKKYVRPQ